MGNTPNRSDAGGGHSVGLPLNPDTLRQQLQQLAEAHAIQTWVLAYSGGVDSQVLLHLLKQTAVPLTAVYIDHGLQAESKQWAEHCRYQCQQLNIPFHSLRVDAAAQKRESPESAARRARYQALRAFIDAHTCLLTAQHRDDQSETVLLQLLRGGAAAGVAAMPLISQFAQGWHARPLLNTAQSDIHDYARQHHLTWVEDPSNQQQHYGRNYLRLQVMPKLLQRWPSVDKTLFHFASQQAENARLLEELAQLDLSRAMPEPLCLELKPILALTEARQRNALRYWIRQHQLPMPSRAILMQVITQLLVPHAQHQAVVSWSGVELRRYRNRLYLIQVRDHDPSQVFTMQVGETLCLDSLGQQFRLARQADSSAQDFVLQTGIADQTLSVGFRQGGERIQMAGRKGHHDLKSLFQAFAVPAWKRDQVPLLYVNQQLAAVVGYCLADAFACRGEGYRPRLEPLNPGQSAG